jgi:hypothetical protein
VEGRALGAGRIGVDDLVGLLQPLQTALERVAMVLRGEASVKPGRRPAEVQRLTRLQLVGMSPGSVILELDFEREQVPLFQSLELGCRAARVLVEGLALLEHRGEMPAGWDVGVAEAVRELGALFRRGTQQISFELPGNGKAANLLPPHIERLAQLITRPLPSQQSVEGRLLMGDFKESGRRCRVHPPIGAPVECIFDEAQASAILNALTKYVRVTGEAVVEPSTGRVRGLTVTDVKVLDWEEAEAWGEYPFWKPLDLDELVHLQAIRPVDSAECLRADIWESEEELEEFLTDVYASRSRDLVG